MSLDPNNSLTWQLMGELFTEMCSFTSPVDLGETGEKDSDKNYQSQILSTAENFEIYEYNHNEGLDYGTGLAKMPLNTHSHQEMVAYATQCLMVAADLELTEPIESFYILPRAIKQFW